MRDSPNRTTAAWPQAGTGSSTLSGAGTGASPDVRLVPGAQGQRTLGKQGPRSLAAGAGAMFVVPGLLGRLLLPALLDRYDERRGGAEHPRADWGEGAAGDPLALPRGGRSGRSRRRRRLRGRVKVGVVPGSHARRLGLDTGSPGPATDHPRWPSREARHGRAPMSGDNEAPVVGTTGASGGHGRGTSRLTPARPCRRLGVARDAPDSAQRMRLIENDSALPTALASPAQTALKWFLPNLSRFTLME